MQQLNHELDLVSIGECLIELSPESCGSCYRYAWAGDVINTLFYASRLGLRTGFVSAFGDDLFTGVIREGIEKEGIDLSLTDMIAGKQNGLYVIEPDPSGEYTFHFWRKNSAATETLQRIDPERLIQYISGSSWFLFSGITLAVMKEYKRLIDVLAQLQSSGRTKGAFDTNYRPALWNSVDDYQAAVNDVAPFIDLFLPSESDLSLAWPDRSPKEVLSSLSLAHVAMKRGKKGCLLRWEGKSHELPLTETVEVVDTTGAGDAFNAGFLSGLVQGCTPVKAAQRGMQVAGHVIGVPGAIDPGFVPKR